MQKYPTILNGKIDYRDAREGGDIGAVMDKYDPDQAKVSSTETSVDIIFFRYADVKLLYAETFNELNGLTAEAYAFLNDVKTVHVNYLLYQDSLKNPSEKPFRMSVCMNYGLKAFAGMI